MPVFTRVRDGVLVLTADGDYTPGELQRVGARAFESEDAAAPRPLVLDLSGAAGLETKTDEALRAEGEALAAHRGRISRVAVVVSSRFAERYDGAGAFARSVGVETRACPSHAAALEWVEAGG